MNRIERTIDLSSCHWRTKNQWFKEILGSDFKYRRKENHNQFSHTNRYNLFFRGPFFPLESVKTLIPQTL